MSESNANFDDFIVLKILSKMESLFLKLDFFQMVEKRKK